MRHRVVHDYFAVDHDDILWSAATVDIPDLAKKSQAIVNPPTDPPESISHAG